MSIEEQLIKLVGITFLFYHGIKVLILSTIRAYKEIVLEIHNNIHEIQNKQIETNLNYKLIGKE